MRCASAITWPAASNIAVEQSARSLMFGENEVRTKVAPISSAVARRWRAITSAFIGSTAFAILKRLLSTNSPFRVCRNLGHSIARTPALRRYDGLNQRLLLCASHGSAGELRDLLRVVQSFGRARRDLLRQ